MKKLYPLLLFVIVMIGCTPLQIIKNQDKPTEVDITKAAPTIPQIPEVQLLPAHPSMDLNVMPSPFANLPSKEELLEATKQKTHVVPTFYPVTMPYQKVRYDGWGDGHFGASRGRRIHNGLDILISPQSAVYSPIEGVVVRKAYPYGEGRHKKWEGIVIKGVNAYKGYEVKIFYVNPFLIGQHVYPNDIVGKAQAISKKYSSRMRDHLHIEVRYYGSLMDPAPLFDLIE